MQLPFSHDQFLDVFGAYNRALWPAVILIWLLTAAAIAALYLRDPWASRLVAAVLAFHWGWAGIAYHLAFFRSINPAATLFGAVFVLQGALFLWLGVLGSQLSFQFTCSVWGRIGAALIAYSLLYPALGLALGLAYPRLPSFGVPCPTAILTVGLLLLAPRHEARRLGAIPLLWAAIGGSAAVLLNIRADFALIVAGLLLLWFAAAGPRSSDTRAA
jgi:Family of unknown function (DUF6064)